MSPGTFWDMKLQRRRIGRRSSSLVITALDILYKNHTQTLYSLSIYAQHNGRLRIKSHPRSRRNITPIPQRSQRSQRSSANPTTTNPSKHTRQPENQRRSPTSSSIKQPRRPCSSSRPLRWPNSKTPTTRRRHPLRSHKPRRLRSRLRSLAPLTRRRATQPNSLSVVCFRTDGSFHPGSKEEPGHCGAACACEVAGEGGG